MTPKDAERLITFYDSYAPHLTGGPYTVTVEHRVEDSQGPLGTPETDFPAVTRRFEVQAPRFTLDPGHVHAMHPPPGSAGNYDTRLAHISLTRATMPWEQELDPERENGSRVPWLALLLFAEGELPGDPHAQAKAETRTVRELIDPGQGDVLGPRIGNVSEQVLRGPCRTIDVPTDVFLAVVPHEDELTSLAHVRKVSQAAPSSRAQQDATAQDPPGLYGVILGNRFPRTPGYYAAHLVSLEGFAPYLKPGAARPQRGLVRLAALASWSFTSHPDARGHFSDIVAALAADGLKEPRGRHLALRLPPLAQDDGSPEAGEINDRLAWGYAPLAHVQATGERSFGWYRGPLSPVPQPAVPGLDTEGSEPAAARGADGSEPPPATDADTGDRADGAAGTHIAHSADGPGGGSGAYRGDSPDGLLVYAPDWGVFDVSYAAAWTMGRLLALAHAPARTAVSRLWQQVRLTALPALSRLDAPADVSGFDARELTATDALPTRNPAVDHFHRLLAEGLPGRLGRAPAQSAGTAAARHADPPARSTGSVAARHADPLARSTGSVAARHADSSARSAAARKERLRSLLRRAEVRDGLAQALAEHTDPVAELIDSLRTLETVPFDHMVPDARMLPAESLRFFHVDAAWVAALTDGVLSAGMSTSADHALSGIVREAVAARLGSRPGADRPPRAGVLMRSRLARDWPGLIVEAARDGAPVALVRRDRLAPDVLLCLFDEVPETVTISEPHQDLYVGVSHTQGRYLVELRALDDRHGHVTGEETGGTFPAEGDPEYGQGLDAYLRRQPGEVLDIARLAGPLAAALGTPEVTPAALALQLVVSPTRQSFIQPPPPA
ncbi:hypothetical protein [Streptomyces sp. A012304]|uniref:hypothetical protein n=1 Tax=Streptomyces sp. A012304 TaxID=375446 RepID=UPI0022303997|nr:hypothetical protein [Streptomyces sp. A012304]GKQ34617.1 hypothetical protein ALMP_11660 [Streptomyces sp. A012304]